MTEFSRAVAGCVADWGRSASQCNGKSECLERSARQLRECLDAAFPDSVRVKIESDKVNYMLSSVFFLANRLSKASLGLAEFDKAASRIEKAGKERPAGAKSAKINERFSKELDDILATYF